VKSSRTDFVKSFGKSGVWDRSPEYQLLWPEGADALNDEFAENSCRLWGPILARREEIKKPRGGKK